MSHYKLLVDYGITSHANKWDKVVKENSQEKIDVYWRDQINPNQAAYNEFLRMKKDNPYKSPQWCAKMTDLQTEKDLSVLSHILSHFIGYRPDMKEYEVKLVL